MDGANTSYKAAEIHALAMAPAHSSHSRDPAIPMSRAGAPILAIVKCEWIKEGKKYKYEHCPKGVFNLGKIPRGEGLWECQTF